MSKQRRRTQGGGTSGAKALLTVLALAGTIGGWAKLSAEGAADEAPAPSPTPLVLALPPVPTLVPAPTDIDAPVPVVQPTQPTLRRVSAPQPSSGGGGGGAAAVSRSSK